MKKICAVFALFCAMFFFAACGGDGTKIINEHNSDSTSEMTTRTQN